MKVAIDLDRAEEVFRLTTKALSAKDYPYHKIVLPQENKNLPKNMELGGKDHARFLFSACFYMRGGVKSDTAIRFLASAYEANPEIWTPEVYCGMENSKARNLITRIVAGTGLKYRVQEISKFWVFDFTKLDRFWDGDPRNIFPGTGKKEDYEVVCERLIGKRTKFYPDNPSGFYGFREKMTSMLSYFLMDSGLIAPFLFPVPIDFHVLRILIATKVLTVSGKEIGEDLLSEDLLSSAREVSMWFCKKYGINPLRLCDSLWFLSSTACKRHPGNTSAIGVRNGRQTEISAVPFKWTREKAVLYERSCGRCPIEHLCEFNVPWAYYIYYGSIVAIGKRKKPPSVQMWFFK